MSFAHQAGRAYPFLRNATLLDVEGKVVKCRGLELRLGLQQLHDEVRRVRRDVFTSRLADELYPARAPRERIDSQSQQEQS